MPRSHAGGWQRRLGVALLLAGTLGGCGSPDALQYTYTLEQRVQYTLFSGSGNILSGDRVTFLRGDCPAPCTGGTNISQIFTATATPSGLVAVNFTDIFPDNVSIFLSIYVDKNDSKVMDTETWCGAPTRRVSPAMRLRGWQSI